MPLAPLSSRAPRRDPDPRDECFGSSYRTSVHNNKGRWLWILAFARMTAELENA
jgi:hypothetical protein